MRWSGTAAAAASLVAGAVASSLTPPVLPLIVRNPYLSIWMGNARNEPWKKWPIFYTGEEIGFSIMAHVPSIGTVYPLLGKPVECQYPSTEATGYRVSCPVYQGANYDASTTNLTYRIDDPDTRYPLLNITISFLSPITPTSTLRQSIPASYVTVHVVGAVDISVYIDLNGQWVSGDWESVLHSDLQRHGRPVKLKTWQVKRKTELLLSEIRDRAEWGTLHFTAPLDVQHQSGPAAELRQSFAGTGTLNNSIDRIVRRVHGHHGPVFAFSKRCLLSGSGAGAHIRSDNVTFTIAHIQDTVAQFTRKDGPEMMKPLWKEWDPFWNANDLLHFHYTDLANARRLADNYSAQLALDAYESGADDYVDIVALSARQVLGATTFSGTRDQPILFLKEISSNGNFQTIDVIFPSFPFFLYTSPRWLAYLLEPLIEHMLSGRYPNKYAMHDLGSHFPNATGHPDGQDEYMPVEECGNILIMGLALVNSLRYSDDQLSWSRWAAEGEPSPERHGEAPGIFPLGRLQLRDGIDYQDPKWGGPQKGAQQAQQWVARSYRLWKQWTTYLVEFSLEPRNQLSTDDFAGWLALQTNLALKGIIGIKAMSKLTQVAGFADEASSYLATAHEYISKWEEFGMSRDNTHAKVAYDWYGSWTTLYNLYADALLCFHLEDASADRLIPAGVPGQAPLQPSRHEGFVPRHIYAKQSIWYHYVRQRYGLPLDSRHRYTKTDWEFFAMAVASKSVRSEILESVATWINETSTDRPLTDLHETEGQGGYPGINFCARPVVGGHFAFLTLKRACGGRAAAGLAFLDDPVATANNADWIAAAKTAAADFDRSREDKD